MSHTNNKEGAIEERIEQELHNYGAWLLNNPNAEPLERRAEKNNRAKTLAQEVFHQELQKARQDWLREEIVKLEDEKVTNQAKTYDGNDLESACDAYTCAFLEWGEVVRYEHGHDHAIQTIIDRYQSDLDQLTTKTNTDEK